MAENVLTAIFDVESEAFQAATELRSIAVTDAYAISQMALVKKQNGFITPCDGFDTGVKTSDDTFSGMLIGSLVGILGGPIGILLGGSIGGLVGSAIDTDEMAQGISQIEMVASKLKDGDVALIALVQETNEAILDDKLNKFKVTIIRHDAAMVSKEVEEAVKMQKEMEKETKKRMREAKKTEYEEKIKEKRAEIHANFESFKAKFKKD